MRSSVRHARGVAWMLAFVTLAAQSGAQWASIPHSLFQPITLPQTLSFGYPPNSEIPEALFA